MSIGTGELPAKEELETFFFEGMCASGWASPNPSITPHSDLAGWKKTTHTKPFGTHKLLLVDAWGKGKGTTTITLILQDDTFVVAPRITLWVMHYQHPIIFPDKTLPDLQKILNETYSRRKFSGGRGETTHGRDVHYWNNWEGGFSRFSGKEDMWVRKDGTSQYIQAGSTTYWGGCLY